MSTATLVDEAQNTASSEGKQDAPPKTKIRRKHLLLVVLAVLLVAGVCYWLRSTLREYGRRAGRRTLCTAQHTYHWDCDLRQSIGRERPIRDGGDVASRAGS
jgi:hypothetical protein